MRISAEDVRTFETRGYLTIADALPAGTLARWRALSDDLAAHALAGVSTSQGAVRNGRQIQAALFRKGITPVPTRINNLVEQEAEAVLDLLALPALRAVAEVLAGPDAVILSVDLLFKQPHPAGPVLWHQDAPTDRAYPYLMVGLYLDDALAGDGCVRCVPGTQGVVADLGELVRNHGWEPPGVEDMAARAGDLLVHDAMLVHGSPPKRAPGARRTLYVEIRPAAAIRESGSQSVAWLALRERWTALVRARAQGTPLPEPIEGLTAEIAALPERPLPSNYQGLMERGPGYPLPDDLLSAVPEV